MSANAIDRVFAAIRTDRGIGDECLARYFARRRCRGTELPAETRQVVASTPDSFWQFLAAELRKWGAVTKAAGIRSES